MDTHKRSLIIAAGLAAIGLLVGLCLLAGSPRAVGAATYTVCPAGPPTCDYATIQEAVDAAGDGDVIKVASGTYSGVSARPAPPGYAFPPPSGLITQVVYLSETLTIRGGYTTSNGFADPPDPEANPTTVDAQGQGRVFFVGAGSGLISPTLEGLRITHGDGTGLGGHPWDPNWDMTGGIYALSASVTISNNWILDNATGFCGGLMVLVGSITVEGNTISGNRATTHLGGGMCVFVCTGSIRGNTLDDNTAVPNNRGGGMIVGWSDTTLEGNSFISNTAGVAGGLEVNRSTVTLSGNTFLSNTAVWQGGAMTIYEYDNDVTLVGNSFLSNTAGTWGGGLYVEGITSTVTLDANTFSDNTAASGGALYVNQTPVTLNGNTIVLNNAQTGGGLYLWGSAATLDGNTISANVAQNNGGGLYLMSYSNPTLTNNLIADNQAGGVGSGFYVWYSSPTLLHTTIARNTGGDASGLHLAGSGTTTMSNTILVSHTVGVTVTANASAVLEGTLWGSGPWGNGQDWGGDGSIVTGTVNLWADPAFVDPDMGDYHLSLASAAIDAGVEAGVDHDIDGEARPAGAGYDIGADEYPFAVNIVKQAYPDPVQSGEQLTYTLRLTNTGDVILSAIITDVLPAQVTPTGVLTWTAQITAPGGTWAQTFAVTVLPGYAGPLDNVMQVAADGMALATTRTVTVQCDPVAILSVTPAISGCVVDFGAELTGTAPFTYDWDFGPFGGSSAPTPTVDFLSDGTYPFTLTVLNCGGAYSDTYAGEVTVTCPCVPVTNTQFTWTPLTPTVRQTVTFTASAEGSPPITFTWDFGDGASGMGPVVTHSYTMTGTYSVTLTATNCVTATQTVVETITVEPRVYRIYLPLVLRGY